MLIKTANEIILVDPVEVIGFNHDITGDMVLTEESYSAEYYGDVITVHGTIRIFGSKKDIEYVRDKLLGLLNKV